MSESKKRFVTTTDSMGGYFAVLYWWNDKDIPGQGFWEPWDTGFGRYSTEDKAIEEAISWAEAEGLEYVPRLLPSTERSKREIIEHWLKTGEVLPPAKGDETYLSFPDISEEEGQSLAVLTSTLFSMGEFVKPPV